MAVATAQDYTPPALAETSVCILGSRVQLVTASRTADYMERWICMRDGRCRQIVTTGFHGLMEAHKKPGLRAILNQADLWAPDGIAPVWLARLRGHRHAVRAPGAEIMREFFTRAQERHYSSYFYGDTDATLSDLTGTVARFYPGHRIAGAYSPPFRALTRAEDNVIIDRINASGADVLWVALGMPKQDVWIHEHLQRLNVHVAVGVGAAFAFVARTVSRCPEWIGDAGFEWAYRFLREPAKLWRRDLIDGPRFIFHAAMEFLRNGNSMISPSNNAE